MRLVTGSLLVIVMLSAAALVSAQQGDKKKGDKADKADKSGADAFVAKLMAFNKKKDGKLTKEELTDERLHRLFDRADANKDGVVTKEELVALYEKEFAQGGGPGKGGPDKGGKGKGKGGFDKGWPQDRGGRGGPPQPGQVLPEFLQDELEMTDAQKKDLAALQKEVDAKLDKILTKKQKEQLKELRERGPGGPGDRGGPDRGPKDKGPRDKGARQKGDR
jgi:hypothetical protein